MYRYIYIVVLSSISTMNRYKKAVKLLEQLKSIHGELILAQLLKHEIMKNLGSDEKQTVRPYLRLMFELDLIEEEGENVRIKKLG